jgi:hypothetical protein
VISSNSANAQTLPGGGIAPPPATAPAIAQVPAPITPITPINVYPDESLMFQVGDYLGKASFVNSPVMQAISATTVVGKRNDELALLEKLAQTALNNRARQLNYLLSARQLMWNMRAPEKSIAPLTSAINTLKVQPAYSGQTLELSKTDPAAALTLAILEEYPKVCSVQDSLQFRAWVNSAARQHNGHVWYAEGLISGLTDVAAANKMPTLLPRAPEIATDLEGELNWITIRLRDTPSPDQLALRDKVFALLKSVSKNDHVRDYITQYQLHQLGDITKSIEGEVFGLPPDTPIPQPKA